MKCLEIALIWFSIGLLIGAFNWFMNSRCPCGRCCPTNTFDWILTILLGPISIVLWSPPEE